MDFVARRRPQQKLTMIDKQQIRQITDMRMLKRSLRFISKLTGMCRKTVTKYAKNPNAVNKKPGRTSIFEPYRETVKECFFKCCGNCAAAINMFKEKIGEATLKFSDRAFRKFCEGYRKILKELKSEHEKFVNHETAPGVEMQIDFGTKKIMVGGVLTTVHFFEAILSYSRRIFVKAYDAENLSTWKDGTACAFRYFGGVTTTVLSDNAPSLVKSHKANESAVFTDGWLNFSSQWNFTPVACPPGTPTCKPKVERGVRYVKGNALVGREFDDFDKLNEWLLKWSRGYSDKRPLRDPVLPHRTPEERFLLEMGYLNGIDNFEPEPIELTRKVQKTSLVHINGKIYRVPEIAANKDVHILIDDRTITVKLDGETIATLDKAQSVYTPLLLQFNPKATKEDPPSEEEPNPIGRPMKEYEKALGGRWNE